MCRECAVPEAEAVRMAGMFGELVGVCTVPCECGVLVELRSSLTYCGACPRVYVAAPSSQPYAGTVVAMYEGGVRGAKKVNSKGTCGRHWWGWAFVEAVA